MVAVDAAVFTCIASPWPPIKPPLGSVRSPSLLLVWMFISFAVFFSLICHMFLMFFEKYLEEPLCIFTSHAWPLAAISHHSSHEFPGSSYAASCDVHILGISAKTAWYFFEIWRQGSQWQKRQINKIRCSQFKTISDFCTMSMRMFTKKDSSVMPSCHLCSYCLETIMMSLIQFVLLFHLHENLWNS